LRVSFAFGLGDNNKVLEVPVDFRRHLISFIKRILSDTPFFSRFKTDRPGFSPYVFGVSFARLLEKNSCCFKIKPPVVMTFSTGFYELLAGACNGAILLKREVSVLGLCLTHINLLPLLKICKDKARFKLVGHTVFRGKNGYVGAGDPESIEEAINTHLQKKLSFFSQQYGNHNFEIFTKIRVVDASRLQKGVCYHYGGNLTTVRGEVILAGKPELLQFIYDFGLGVRNGQGFGLVEVDNRS